MKRSERHRLKDNPLVRTVAQIQAAVAAYGRTLLVAGVVALGALGAGGGYWAWRSHIEAQADALLVAAHAVAEAPVIPGGAATSSNTPPPAGPTYPSERAKLEAALPAYLRVAERFPKTRAATVALYQAAAAAAALGRLDEAASRYREVMARDPGGIYGQLAELGLAGVHLTAGRTAEAIEVYRRLAGASDTRLPIDGVLIELARAYRKAGQMTEATRTYTRIIEEFPQSMYAAEAKEALETIRPS